MTLRWRFPDPSEAEARAAIDRRIDAWWQGVEAWVRGRSPSSQVPGTVLEPLHGLAEPLTAELRPGRQRHTFVVSAGPHRAFEPLVERIVSRAPALPDVVVAPQREPEPIELAASTIERAHRLSPRDWSVEVEPSRYGLLALKWHGVDGDHAQDAAALFAQSLLGERELADWVGAVEVAPPSLRSKMLGLVRPRGEPAAGLRSKVAQVKAQVLGARADRPLLVWSSKKDPNWTLVKLEPGSGRRDRHQADLERASCADVELFEASRCGLPFSSSRFSRFGELFAYVQTDGFEERGLQTTLALEQAIDSALADGALGRAIGTGTGARFSYVDVVLADVPRALERLLPALRAGNLPKRSWVRFFDDTLAAEWVGVWPDSPAPDGP